jgi:hypothetical protein
VQRAVVSREACRGRLSVEKRAKGGCQSRSVQSAVVAVAAWEHRK